MTPRQKVFALAVGIALFALIINLVYRRKLREEYSWLWLLVSLSVILLTAWYQLLVDLTGLIGATLPTTTLFLAGILFLVFINIHYSTKISALTDQVNALAREMALLRARVEEALPGPGEGEEPVP